MGTAVPMPVSEALLQASDANDHVAYEMINAYAHSSAAQATASTSSRRPAQGGAVSGPHPARRGSLQEAHHRRRAAAQVAQRLAVASVHRGGAGHALGREVVHQAEEERQIRRIDPPLVEGEDEPPALGDQEEVGVLDAFGDALQAHRPPDVVRG